MDIKKLILEKIQKKGFVKAGEVIKITGFSRAYINRFFRELQDKGDIVLFGRANRARYIKASEDIIEREKAKILSVKRIIRNEDVQEDAVLSGIKRTSGIFVGLNKNVSDILEYAFLEMVNNAIEHSCSEKIEIVMESEKEDVFFKVRDKGVGIFNNLRQKKALNSEMEAIQDLLKGKQTTAPREHSGEGVFFTSKAADMFVIQSSSKKLIYNNIIEDIFIDDVKRTSGTKIFFMVKKNSKKELNNIFREYTDDAFVFYKTEVEIKLFKEGASYLSRSQARRILTGLDKFKRIILDFKGLDMVGQGFADEIFRVWKKKNPDIYIETKNANKNITFMIRRAENNEQDTA